MIVVTIDLHSAIHPSRSKRLGKMVIANIGGTNEKGDYAVRTMRGRDLAALEKNIVQRSGTVRGHPRLKLHVWHLVSRALQSVGYTGDHQRTPELRADEIAEFLRWKATHKPTPPDELDTYPAEDEKV